MATRQLRNRVTSSLIPQPFLESAQTAEAIVAAVDSLSAARPLAARDDDRAARRAMFDERGEVVVMKRVARARGERDDARRIAFDGARGRLEEHTSELQS